MGFTTNHYRCLLTKKVNTGIGRFMIQIGPEVFRNPAPNVICTSGGRFVVDDFSKLEIWNILTRSELLF